MVKSIEFDIRRNDSVIVEKDNKINELSEKFINMKTKLSK
jgi:hypothetical protein